jgi:hypothetical protein
MSEQQEELLEPDVYLETIEDLIDFAKSQVVALRAELRTN